MCNIRKLKATPIIMMSLLKKVSSQIGLQLTHSYIIPLRNCSRLIDSCESFIIGFEAWE